MASEKPSHHVRCWTNDGHTCVCLLTDGCASSVRKKLSLALIPLPPIHCSLFLSPSSSLLFLPLLCRRFYIGNTVSALHGNNSGKDDINYLPIVWHMQGIVLAIIISTLSPEGMNGATAALCLCAKPLFRAPVKWIRCTYHPSSREECISIVRLNFRAFIYLQRQRNKTQRQLSNLTKMVTTRTPRWLVGTHCITNKVTRIKEPVSVVKAVVNI